MLYMNHENKKSEPIRELEQLAQFFVEHGREDLAKEIFDQVTRLQRKSPHYVEASAMSELNSLSNNGINRLKLDS